MSAPSREEFEALQARVAELEARLGRIGCQARPPAGYNAPVGVHCTELFGHEGQHQQATSPLFHAGETTYIAWH